HLGPSGHRIHLPDQLLSGTRLSAAEKSGSASKVAAPMTAAGSAQPAVAGAGPATFLTRPYWNHHDVTSVFDHCKPDYSMDGRICEVDGTVATSSNGAD